MKNLQKLAVLAVFVLFVFIRGNCAEINPNSLQTIRIIGDKYYPPYEMLDEQGNPVGFCVDLIKEVMKRLNKPYTLRLVSRNEIMNEVRAGRADVVLELTFTTERAKYLHFGTIYNYAFKGSFFVDNLNSFTRFGQFKNKTVAAEKGSYAEELLRSANFKIKIIPLEKLTDGIQLLNENKCDAVFCNEEIAQYIASQNKGLASSGVGLPPEKFCLACVNEQLLNKMSFAIYDLKEEGIYDKLLNQWMPKDKSKYYQTIIYIGLAIFLVLVLLFIIFYTLFRYRIKVAKRQLEHQRQNLDISLHAGDIGIWGYNVEKKKFFNVFCDYFPPEGRSYDEELTMFHPDDVGIFSNAVLSAAAGNPPTKAICVRMDHSGKHNWRYIEKEIHSMRDSNGKVVNVIGTHKDVTDTIAKQNKIRELLNDHEVMFNNTSIGTQYFDSDGYLTKINESACRIFGLKDKEGLLKVRPNLFDYPQLKERIDRNNLRAEHFIIRDDFDLYQKDKKFKLRGKSGIHYIETYISPVFGADGNLICIIVNNNDVTEREMLRKQVEEYAFQMKYMLKASGVISWIYNPYTHILKSTLQDNELSENIAKDDLFNNIKLGDVEEKMEGLIQNMNNLEDLNFRTQMKFIFTADDEPSYFIIDGTPFKDENGKILYYLGLGINVTDLIGIQNKLKHEKEEAQKADRLKSAFLANVSHEIRTPLNSIIGFSDLLQYTESADEKKQYVDIIRSNNERLLQIIDDVLDLSQIESGTMKLNVGSFDLEPLFNETCGIFARQLMDSPLKVLYDKPYESCIIECDRVRFAQVLTNYMTNAVKYTKEGHIRLGYECVDEGVRLFVEDTGQGIPSDKKDMVFERFEKLNSLVQGTGLGLSICKDIARMFHGKVGVESELGKGSTFWMWIPVHCKVVPLASENISERI
jgi:signal transduction histidine kinase/ABC-type amino acid transport substrate-binding protein/PAS domain-containing protein